MTISASGVTAARKRSLFGRRKAQRHRRLGPWSVLGAMLLVAGAALVTARTAVGAPAGDRSCFLGGVPQRSPAQAATIERATLFIALVRPDGTLVSEGTGFVAGPRRAGRAAPRIITAGHVVARRPETVGDARLMAFFSDGAPIGLLRVVAEPPKRNTISLGGYDIIADDVAVVEIAQFVEGRAQTRFAQIQGLPLAASDQIRVGEASDPVGVIWGFSGAAAVDGAGRVIGVLTGTSFRGHVTLPLGSIQESNAAGRPVARPVTLPTRSLIVVEPLRAATVREALGEAPTGAATAQSAQVVLAGFPLASCAAIAVTLESADSSVGAGLLSLWRRSGLVDAWYQPPSVDPTKLKLTP